MQPPDRGTAALYIKCPACGVWELHVAGTEQVIADTLGNPKLKGWGCTACGHWWDIVPAPIRKDQYEWPDIAAGLRLLVRRLNTDEASGDDARTLRAR